MRARPLGAREESHWDDFLTGLSRSSVRQASGYREALRLYGRRSEVFLVEDSGRILAGALLALRSTLPLLGDMIRVSGGLALPETGAREALKKLLPLLVERARERGALALEVSVRHPREIAGEAVETGEVLGAVLSAEGFQPVAESGTYWVDLAKGSDEDLLAGFAKNVRRDVRKALREGVEVEPSLDERDFEGFAGAYETMTRRKELAVHPEGFSREVLLPLARRGQGELFVARFRGEARNFVYVSRLGDPIYHWGALAAAGQEPGCPPTGQVTQFAVMSRFRALGKKTYDLGGSPGPVPEPGHPNYGVWRFKHAFGGSYVRYVGSWRKVLRPRRWWALQRLRR